jgi:hypothetical protein
MDLSAMRHSLGPLIRDGLVLLRIEAKDRRVKPAESHIVKDIQCQLTSPIEALSRPQSTCRRNSRFVLIKPFRAGGVGLGAAHVVQLGAIGIENLPP